MGAALVMDGLDMSLFTRKWKRAGKKPLPTPETPTVVAPRLCHRGHIPALRYVTGQCVHCFADRRAEQAAYSRLRQRGHAARRAEMERSRGRHDKADIASIGAAQRWKCGYCRSNVAGGFHVDHIIPLIRGGRNDRRNLQILCQGCNQSKGAKDPIEFAASRGLLV